MQSGSSRDGDNATGAGVTLHLEVISGNAAGQSFAVDDELVIGRLASGHGRLEEDPELSRQHARISRERDGRYAIEDLGSSNGTFVNGLALRSPGLLVAGDSIELGGTTLVVREITGASPVETSGPESVSTQAPSPGDSPDPFRDATVFARVPVEAIEVEGRQSESGAFLQPTAPGEPLEAPGEPDSGAPADEGAAASAAIVAPELEDVGDATMDDALPPFDVRVTVDAAAREAHLRVGEHSEPLRFVLDGDGWSLAAPNAD